MAKHMYRLVFKQWADSPYENKPADYITTYSEWQDVPKGGVIRTQGAYEVETKVVPDYVRFDVVEALKGRASQCPEVTKVAGATFRCTKVYTHVEDPGSSHAWTSLDEKHSLYWR